MPMTTICLNCGRPYFRLTGHRCGRRPRLRAARLAAELAEVRAQAARAEDEACRASARADEILSRMQEQAVAAELPRPRHALYLVSTEDGRPGAA